MDNKFLFEAYKPAEKLAFNYLILRDSLDRLLREQKFPKELEIALFKVYKNFQLNANTLISLYSKVPDVLPLSKLLDSIEDETDAIFMDAGLDAPLKNIQTATESLVKFIIDVGLTYLNDSEEYKNSIPGFNWDIDSFKDVFNQIEERGIEYVQKSNNEQI